MSSSPATAVRPGATLTVRDFEPADHEWAKRLIGGHSGGTHVVARLGELIDPLTLEGLVAVADGRPVGLATCKEGPGGLEVVTLHSDPAGVGAGTLLLRTALQVAGASELHRVWLVTTNDNLGAIRFYLRRGMHVAKVHANALKRDRKLKPQIAKKNPDNGLPIRDLLEFELTVGSVSPELPSVAMPSMGDLDLIPAEAFAEAMAPAFEGAPRFLARLAAARPFGTDADLFVHAREIARQMPETEQIELLAAHPRIGADPASVSALSYVEQGYGEQSAPSPDEPGEPTGPDPWAAWEATQVSEPWVADELAALNDAYEARFGFRFVVFVAGRPRREIIPILERALHADRNEELRRGLDDVIYIAADRMATLRRAAPEGIGR
jgi:2-oxo-4-hydroxy-4-carboxy-5-ureidoimidazoline decarboxylase